MRENDVRERIVAQFSYRGDRADVWRAFDLVLPTGGFLNLGYAPWYLPYPVAASQRRLAAVVGRRLATHLPETDGLRLLDIGCGRGGPAVHLADRHGFRVTGVDLVPYNVRRARANASREDVDAEFLVGDATQLPVGPDAVAAAAAIDALVYTPDRPAAIAEIAEALTHGGVFVATDLVRRRGLDDCDLERVDAFADAWDMPRPWTVEAHIEAMTAAGLAVTQLRELTPHSLRRYRRWTRPYLALADGPFEPAVDHALRAANLDPAVIGDAVRTAHRAVPSLRHVMVVATATT